MAKFKGLVDVLEDIKDIEMDEWSDNFSNNIDKAMKTLAGTGNNFIDYFRYFWRYVIIC